MAETYAAWNICSFFNWPSDSIRTALNDFIASAEISGDLARVPERFVGHKISPALAHWALVCAAEGGHVKVARCLFSQGVTISAPVVYAATCAKSLDIFKVFAEYGWGLRTNARSVYGAFE